MNNLEKAKLYTYPEIKVEIYKLGGNQFESVKILTWLRKEHEGKYYLIPIIWSAYNIKNIADGFRFFLKEVYKVEQLYILPSNALDYQGNFLVLEDNSIISEKERVLNTYIFCQGLENENL